MKKAVIRRGALHGAVTPPPSKSVAHRAILCAALARGKSEISPCALSEDIKATERAVSALGTRLERRGECLFVDGGTTFSVGKAAVDCGESGSTLRFVIPCAAAGGVSALFTGRGRLPLRPLDVYLNLLPRFGVRCDSAGGLPLSISGRLKSGEFRLPGNVSSQFITGLLLALPLLDGDSAVVPTTKVESKNYIDITLGVMKTFGVTVKERDGRFEIPGRQRYAPRRFTVERDWSQAAPWLVSGALAGKMTVMGLDPASRQGDRAVVEFLRRFGAEIVRSDAGFTVTASKLHGISIDGSQIPDLVPALAAAACGAEGRTVINNAARLRLKESDRIASTAAALGALGADIRETEDGLVIDGGKPLKGGRVPDFNDHRIVMAAAAASALCEGPVEIESCGCVDKSYPEFFQDFMQAGGDADVVDMG